MNFFKVCGECERSDKQFIIAASKLTKFSCKITQVSLKQSNFKVLLLTHIFYTLVV